MYKIILLVIFIHFFVYPQLRYVTVANSSTVTNYGDDYQMTAQTKNNVLISFKRGTGTTSADREIRVARSTNAGVSFTETNITIPTNTNTYAPIIASTPTSVVCLYDYDSSSTEKVCLARSTNSGNTFTLQTSTNSYLQFLFRYSWYTDFLSDGVSKYFVGDGNYLFASTDNGITFVEKTLPSSITSAYYAKLAVTQNYLWVMFNKSAGDSIYVYRSSDNGNTFQYITQFNNDFYSKTAMTCTAYSNQLIMAYIHEEVGTFYLRTRTITGTTLGSSKDIEVTTSYLSGTLNIKKNSNNIFLGFDQYIYRSTDNGNSWSRKANSLCEIGNYPYNNMYVALDDTTIYIHSSISSTGTLRQQLFGNWKWTDMPTSTLTNDTLLTSYQYFYLPFNNYVTTPQDRLQFSTSSNFSSIILDTLDDYSFDVAMDNRFVANGTRYYYRLRGEDGNYTTAWSSTKSFRFGSVLTGTPTLIAPVNGSTTNYPSIVNFQWGSVQNATGSNFHFSTKSNFADTILWRSTSQNTLSYFPFGPGNAILNGTFYWRVRGIEMATGSFGPWSTIGSFQYAGAPTDINEKPASVPINFSVSQNYPNPFNPLTVIQFALPYESAVKIKVLDILGQEIAELDNSTRKAGYYEVNFHAGNLSSGIYLYTVSAKSIDGKNEYHSVKKMMLLK